VLEKTPTSILVRCGDSPFVNPDSPRQSDGVFEMYAKADFDKGYAEFRLKSVFFVGLQDEAAAALASSSSAAPVSATGEKKRLLEEKPAGADRHAPASNEVVPAPTTTTTETWENKGPMQGSMWFAHKLYTKLWMEAAVTRVRGSAGWGFNV
jgi:hypothetical protein